MKMLDRIRMTFLCHIIQAPLMYPSFFAPKKKSLPIWQTFG